MRFVFASLLLCVLLASGFPAPGSSTTNSGSQFTSSLPSLPLKCTNGQACAGWQNLAGPLVVSRFFIASFVDLPAGGITLTSVVHSDVASRTASGYIALQLFSYGASAPNYNNNLQLGSTLQAYTLTDNNPQAVSGGALVVHNGDMVIFTMAFFNGGDSVYAQSFSAIFNYAGGAIIVSVPPNAAAPTLSPQLTLTEPVLPLACSHGMTCPGQIVAAWPLAESRFIMGSVVGLPSSGVTITNVTHTDTGYALSNGFIALQIFAFGSSTPKYDNNLRLGNTLGMYTNADYEPQAVGGGPLVIYNTDFIIFDLVYFNSGDWVYAQALSAVLAYDDGIIAVSIQ